MKNGTTILPIQFEEPLRAIILKKAKTENRLPDEVIVDLVRTGLECGRLHRKV